MAETIDGLPDVHLIDTRLMDLPRANGVYVVDADRTVLVDAGTMSGADRVLAGLGDLGIARGDVDAVLLTHAHMDHCGGAPAVLEACPDARVACPAPVVDLLTDAEKVDELYDRFRRALGSPDGAYGGAEPLPADRVDPVEPGDRLDLGGRVLDVVAAPGHVEHQVVYHDPEAGALFVADEVGLSLMGELHPSTPPPQFSLERTLGSLDRFLALDPDVLLFPHFGPRQDARATLERYGDLLADFVDDVDAARGHRDTVEGIVDALEDDWSAPTLTTDVLGVLGDLGDDRWRDYPGGRVEQA